MEIRAASLRHLALVAVLFATGCSFDFSGFVRQGDGGAGGAGATSSPASVAAGPGPTSGQTSPSATSGGVTTSATSTSSSSTGGGGPVGPCSMPTDDFSSSTTSASTWHQNNSTDFTAATANAHLDFLNDSSGFWANDPNKVALQDCWVSVKVDVKGLTSSKSYGYVDWREDGSHEIRVELNKDGTIWGHITDDVLPDVTFNGFAKTHVRFREEASMVYVETKDATDAVWILVGSAPAPSWLTKKEAFGFGAEHPFPESTGESAAFDNVNLPDMP